MKRSIFFSGFLYLISASANAGIIQINPANSTPQVQKFVNEVEAKLPQKMKDSLAKKKITLTISNLKYDSNQIQIPNCNNKVASFTEADSVIAEYAKAASVTKATSLSYNKQIYSYTDRSNNITMNAGFLPIINQGEYSARTYNCGHRNLYKLAQGALINSLASIYDSSTGTTVKEGNRTRTTSGISESLKYKTIAGWSIKGKRNYGFWPRAVNPFEYAGGPAEHFAQNMEFYLLDPEYACRRPLQQDFFARFFAQNNKPHDPLASQRTCKVNFVLKIPVKTAMNSKDEITDEEIVGNIKEFDLNPNRVFNINYMRAGAGTGAGSFGHAMFKFLSCAPGQSYSSECNKELYSLVINPRANPMEMRLDTMRGIFGGYPSQFLITPMREIRNEYAYEELRHLYNIPLTGARVTDPATKQTMNVLPQDQKARFIYATLDQYWSYYGKYKFLSNNCADEAMRLYQMSSDDEKVLGLGVLLPQDFNKKLSALGLADEAQTKGLEPAHGIFRKLVGALFKKDMKWAQFEDTYQKAFAAGDNTVSISFNYQIMKLVRNVMILEGYPEKATNSTKAITKESQKWVSMASPSMDLDDAELQYYIKNKRISETKLAEIKAHMTNISNRYNALMLRAQTPAQKHDVALSFYWISYLVLQKKRSEIGNEAVKLAYAVAYPKDAKDDVRGKIEPRHYQTIKDALDNYATDQQQMMPYREASTQPGYGIPLESEVTRGLAYAKLIANENKRIDTIIDALGPLIGPDQEIIGQLELFKAQTVKDKDAAKARIPSLR